LGSSELLFEEIWSQIEYLASRRFDDLRQLESEISRIQVTAEDWANCPDHVPEEKGYPHRSNDVQKAVEALLTRNECYVSINSDRGSDTALVARYWNCAVKISNGYCSQCRVYGRDSGKIVSSDIYPITDIKRFCTALVSIF